MIIEYEKKYEEDAKNLLVELQEYLASIDKEGYNILTKDYREEYFKEKLEEMKTKEAKIFLYKEDNEILGLVECLVNNDARETFEFSAPRRGRIAELIVTKDARGKGIGEKLLHYAEEYLHSINCEDILIAVFGYNKNAFNFYRKCGYHIRMMDMTKR